MVILGHYIKTSPHGSKLPGVGRGILDCEGFLLFGLTLNPKRK